MRFKEVRSEEEYTVRGCKVKRIPHIIPVYVAHCEEGFAIFGFMDRDSVLVYENTLPPALLSELVEEIRRERDRKVRETIGSVP